MGKLRLSLACWNYDRVRAIADGRVSPEGIDLNLMTLPVEETFFRMLRHREFDAAEMSLSSYAVSLTRPDPAFIALPVFPSRFFRHSCIFVSTRSHIERPEDLAGARVGVPEFQMTAPVWIRGVLQDDYGVDPASPRYFTGGEEEPGREEKLALNLPPRFSVTPIGPAQTLSAMLAEGEIDALHTARAPSTFYSRPDAVRRLFPDPDAVEKAYFQRTRMFPIMHVIALRRDVYERDPWIARSLYKAFAAAKQLAYDELKVTASLATMLPWQTTAVEEAVREMGPDWWSYGLETNRATLDTFLRYHNEQGLSATRLTPEALFAPETLESFKI
ncbi:MAG TPA: ABC transporter substrate-binding protein [Caulobacteraceae bacterium]|nr:ABC transporter substrate-binding protein [Caulobacteraceae bacterium]